MALDGQGNLFIVDSFNARVRRVAANGMITTVAGDGTFGNRGDGGPAIEAQFRFPAGIARDSAGNLYVADTQNNRIRFLAAAPAPSSAGGSPPSPRMA